MKLNGKIKVTGNGIYFIIVLKIAEYGFPKNQNGVAGLWILQKDKVLSGYFSS